jgi:hypothetical protein
MVVDEFFVGIILGICIGAGIAAALALYILR